MLINKLKSSDQVDLHYSNLISELIDLTKPQDVFLIGGRGLAKTTDIIPKRLIDIIYEMPGAPLAIVSDTYINAMTNIIPYISEGLNRNKFLKDYHWISGHKPPDKWDKSTLDIQDFKHIISTFNGVRILIKSLDRPSIGAGISVAHLVGDEAKYFKRDKLENAFPTVRGNRILFGNSPYFMGHTFTTDMPNVALVSNDDWILDMEKKFSPKVIVDLLHIGFVINEILKEYLDAKLNNEPESNLVKIKRNLQLWYERQRLYRRGTTLFLIVSTLANIDILTYEYFLDQYNKMDYETFKRAILSIKCTLDKSLRFYANLGDRHFYEDGVDYENNYDQINLGEELIETSSALRYINSNALIEAGFDAGNQMSLVIGQLQLNEYRVLKEFYTLSPSFIRELATQFINFFHPHKYKLLHLRYDRSANQYSKSKKDFANQLKHDIEYDMYGKRTGWDVFLLSEGQGNIYHSEEYNLMNVIMGEKEKRLPKLLIDKWQCKNLKSSLELAPLLKDSKGIIKKDKRSEKLSPDRLVAESTNFSDAFKYLICRKEWLSIVNHKTIL